MTGAAIILAGGRSRRLGQPKELVKAGGLTLLDTTIEACSGCEPVVVVGPHRTDISGDVYQVREDPPHSGPVAAIATGLSVVTARAVLVLSCDMPRVGEVVEILRSHASRLSDSDVVLLRTSGRIQPLAALWSVPALERALASEPTTDRSVNSLLRDVRTCQIDVDPELTQDIDQPADLQLLWPAGAVASAMLTQPTVVAADADVATLRRCLQNPRVHLAIVTDGPRVVSAVVAEDLASTVVEDRAADVGTLVDRTTTADANLRTVAAEMVARGQRRKVVVDADHNLLGLLCLNRRGDGFCTDDGVRSRRGDRV